MKIFQSRTTSFKLRVTSYELRVTRCEFWWLRFVSRLEAANCALRIFNKVQVFKRNGLFSKLDFLNFKKEQQGNNANQHHQEVQFWVAVNGFLATLG
jgi:hypothetical protein